MDHLTNAALAMTMRIAMRTLTSATATLAECDSARARYDRAETEQTRRMCASCPSVWR